MRPNRLTAARTAASASAPLVTSSLTTSRSSDSRSEEHTSELQSQSNLVCRLLLEKKNTNDIAHAIFPSSSPIVSLVGSLAAFATGSLARPIGGIVLSHYRRRIGRCRECPYSVFVR